MATPPRAKLASGPAAAIQPSALGVRASRSSRAKPPSPHSSMALVGMSKRRATRAWPSSWTRIEAKKMATPTMARANPTPRAMLAASRAATTSALQWMRTAAPTSRPSEIDPVFIDGRPW